MINVWLKGDFKMRKHLKKMSVVLLPLFLFGSLTACTPTQVSTAQNVMHQAEFYVDMADALVKVAIAKYSDNPKVRTALVATSASLQTVKRAMQVAGSGLAQDQEALRAAVVSLVVEVFNLAQAIKEAQSA